jgi:uroporphyrinogen-III synthase
MGALTGKTVAVTRPAAQAETLCRAIEEAGGEAFRFPLLEIVPITEPAVFAPVAARLEEFDLIFFVSANAVEHGLTGLRRAASWPPGLRVATVGQGSARALRAHGFDTAIVPTDGFDSEAVLALPEFSPEAVRGRAVLIVRGDGGRELLGDTLASRGARVECLSCYQRRCPDAADPAALLDRAACGRLDALSITSSEGVDHLARILGAEALPRLAQIPVFAPHPRIAARCRLHGLEHIVATGAGDDALLRALTAFFG